MKKSNMSLIIIVALTALILAACSGEDENTSGNESENSSSTQGETVTDDAYAEEVTVYNAESLAAFDGQNGNAAYIAIEGIVYDVTNHPMWKNGTHQGSFQAGKDLTEEMKGAPHGLAKLTGLEEVGTYE